jgi:predicted ATPase
LANLGYGMTKLVHLILKVAQTANSNYMDLGSPSEFIGSYPEKPYYPSIILLEEPEANLHPSFQSKIAELIVDAYQEFNIQFIIETHSEYLIRNFQYLTATKEIPSNASKIYYFHHPETEDFEESPYRVIEIMKDGRLSNEFGEGFFDEIPRLLAFLYNSSFN